MKTLVLKFTHSIINMETRILYHTPFSHSIDSLSGLSRAILSSEKLVGAEYSPDVPSMTIVTTRKHWMCFWKMDLMWTMSIRLLIEKDVDMNQGPWDQPTRDAEFIADALHDDYLLKIKPTDLTWCSSFGHASPRGSPQDGGDCGWFKLTIT